MPLGKRWRWNRAVSLGSVIAITASLVTIAYASPGLPITQVDLNDSGIWVTSEVQGVIGRFNHQANALDGVVYPNSTRFDVQQDGANVFVRDLIQGSYVSVDAAKLKPGSQVQLGPAAQMEVGGGTVAILDTDLGELWIMSASGSTGFMEDDTIYPPTQEDISEGGVVAVGPDGTTYLLDPAVSTITVYPPTTSSAKPTTMKLSNVDKAGVFKMTVVGTTPVAYDSTNKMLYPGTHSPIKLDLTDAQSATLALQQPSGGAPTVAYSTSESLVSQPLNGGKAKTTSIPGGGVPAQPVQLDGCTYGVWSVTAAFVRDCGDGGDNAIAKVPKADPADQLSFRTNRGYIVLNQLNSGAVWLVTGQLVQVDDWQSVLTASKGDTSEVESEERDQSQKPDLNQPDQPPVANDDTFGVRPGRSTLLPVLENDISPNGYLLTASLDGDPPSIGTLSLVYSSSVFQIDVPDNATGSSSFRYEASDGRGGTATANVNVDIHPMTVNAPPDAVRKTNLTVTSGKKVSYNVLSDWRDPDGDTIFLTRAAPDSLDDSVTFTADGQVTYQDGGKATGVKAINVTVSDGREETEAKIQVTVLPPANQPPVTINDLASGTVDTPITIHPLQNDSDPSNRPITLTSVSTDPRCALTNDFVAATVTANCTTAGSVYLIYTITNGPSPNVYGLIRIDVTDPATDDPTPIAVPDTTLLHAGQPVSVPVLQNDVNPLGWPLVVVAASAPDGAPVQVAVINHETVVVTPLRDFTDPLTLHYTISNGQAFGSSTIMVVPVPAPAYISPPVAGDDTVRVRVGDVATVAVLANDKQPDGIPIKLLPDLVETPNTDTEAVVFTSGNYVRVQARDTPGTYTVLYKVAAIEGTAEPATGRLTIYVTKADPEHNQAPKPVDVLARTVAGQPVTIPIPLNGVDPDGDSVTLVGIASAPAQGLVTAVAGNSIVYDPTPQVTGSVKFTYTLRDHLGLDGIGTVIVGIAPESATNDPPVAVTDNIESRPGRSIAYPVTLNDYDPGGGAVKLVTDSVESRDFNGTTQNNRVVFTAPSAPGDYSATYQIQNTYGQTATGIMAIHVADDVPLQKPVPQDDFVPMAAAFAGLTVSVDVIKNDSDPGGNVVDDTISVTDPNATVTGGQVVVTLTTSPQIIAYNLTNPDNLVGQAFIWVPGTDTTPPQYKTDVEGLTVHAGQSVDFLLADYVSVRAGRNPRITSPDKMTAWNGTVSSNSPTQLRFAAPADYQGPASASMEVTDGADLNDPTGLAAAITIPITVLPPEKGANQPPTFANPSVTVEMGGNGTVDLAPFVVDPENDALTFAVVSQPLLAGLQATIAGTTLTVTAAADVPKRSVTTMVVSVSDGNNPAVQAQAQITVVASTRPLTQTVTDSMDNAHQGQTYCINATANDVNPFPDVPLTVIGARVATGVGVTSTGCSGVGSVSVTPDDHFVGQMVVVYTVQDATKDSDRNVDGTITLIVKGRPDPPSGVHVDSVGDQTVTLSWQPPNNNGAPITGYTVIGTPSFTQQCSGTICILTGLTNNVTYTFVVTATNEVGTSDPSPTSDQARPDAIPNTPSPPLLGFGDRSLTITWTNPGSRGSPVTSYMLMISPAANNGQSIITGVTGTSFVWSGLTNGQAYTVRVCPVNLAPGVCENTDAAPWSGQSKPEIPAAPPDPPTSINVAWPSASQDGTTVNVCWGNVTGAAANGDAVSSYTLQASGGAGSVAPVSVTPTPGAQTCRSWTLPISDQDYRFTVSGTNKAGPGPYSAASAPFRSFAAPGDPMLGGLTDGDGSCTLSITSQSALNGARASEVVYRYQAGNGATGTIPYGSSTGVIGGLPNGTQNGYQTRYSISSIIAVTTVNGISRSSSGAYTTNLGCRPYGPPKQPGLEVAAGGSGDSSVYFAVRDPGANGRNYKLQQAIDGGAWADTVAHEGQAVTGSWSQTHTFSARTCETEAPNRCSDPVTKTITANAQPQPAVYIVKGAGGNTMTIYFKDMPNQAYQVKIYYNKGAGDVWFDCVHFDGGPIGSCTSSQNFSQYNIPGSYNYQTVTGMSNMNKYSPCKVRIEIVGLMSSAYIDW